MARTLSLGLLAAAALLTVSFGASAQNLKVGDVCLPQGVADPAQFQDCRVHAADAGQFCRCRILPGVSTPRVAGQAVTKRTAGGADLGEAATGTVRAN